MVRLLYYSLKVLRSYDNSDRLSETESRSDIEEGDIEEGDNESSSGSNYEGDSKIDSEGESNSRLDT